jgi:hypothetical protein
MQPQINVMSPQIKFGLIVGGIGFLLKICTIFTPFGWWGGWVLAALVGGLASFLAVRAQPLLSAGGAARAGSKRRRHSECSLFVATLGDSRRNLHFDSEFRAIASCCTR